MGETPVSSSYYGWLLLLSLLFIYSLRPSFTCNYNSLIQRTFTECHVMYYAKFKGYKDKDDIFCPWGTHSLARQTYASTSNATEGAKCDTRGWAQNAVEGWSRRGLSSPVWEILLRGGTLRWRVHQAGLRRWSSRHKQGFAKAWRHDSCRHPGRCAQQGITGARKPRGEGREEGKQEPEGF